MTIDNYQLTAGGARSITTISINKELKDVFKQIRDAAENGEYSINIFYDPESDFPSRYFKYNRRLTEMGYETQLDREKKIMTINW